jgi:hypothetical protein
MWTVELDEELRRLCEGSGVCFPTKSTISLYGFEAQTGIFTPQEIAPRAHGNSFALNSGCMQHDPMRRKARWWEDQTKNFPGGMTGKQLQQVRDIMDMKTYTWEV